MSSSRGSLTGLLALLVALLMQACTSSHRCASGETCNGRDDDCDGRVDEDFLDGRGRYVTDEHCGSCAVRCDDVFPSALETSCNAEPVTPTCALVACPPGTHAFPDGACIPDQPVLCLPCARDEDCGARTAGARCVAVAGEQRCGTPCASDADCAPSFRCSRESGQCTPEPTLCACLGSDARFEVACLAQGAATSLFCAGTASCGPEGLGSCTIASIESCDGDDDDCDGRVDEGFVDTGGRYVGSLHCGGCGKPCVSPGPHYDASCRVVGSLAGCEISCEPGYVDVDGIRANGCECQVFTGTSAPVVVGGDANCDGSVDDSDAFVHVTTGGSDSALGTLVQPMRTLEAALERAATQRKAVLVAQGSYEPFAVRAGVSVFGGYRADFRARDPELFPVVIEPARASDGAPVLRCSGVRAPTTIEGLTLRGGEAESAGRGSTAAFFDGCGPELRLVQVTVLAGRGADGQRGDDASARLPAGLPSLAALAGSAAEPGRDGDSAERACLLQAGGAAGQKLCGSEDVSGGEGGGSGCGETGCTNGSPCANAGCTDFTVDGVCDYATVLRLALPNPLASDGRGRAPGRAGAPTYNAPTNRGVCNFCDDNPTLQRLGQDGGDGAPGSAGVAGVGCAGTALAFDPSGRASAGSGLGGASGSAGSGGGGGSGGSGYDVIGGTQGMCDDTAGGSGGGGGSGGCGAPGGAGGGGAGASIGILVRATLEGAGPVFERVRVVTASGGRGGDGGIGAAGGRGGAGALGGRSRYFCARNGGRGGDGGEGGAGGGGGGGCGGASHALVVDGPAAVTYRAQAASALTIERAGVPGQGGRGGFSPSLSGLAGGLGADEPVR